VDVEVVGHLDAPDELEELVVKVFAPLGRHHKVVLEVDGETVANRVARVRALGLGEGACGGLVRHPAGEALVEGPDVPLDLPVDVVDVTVGQDDAGERGIGGVGDEAVDAIGEPGVGPLEDVGEVPAAVALVLLEVILDVARGGAEDVLVVLHSGVGGAIGIGAAAAGARVSARQIG